MPELAVLVIGVGNSLRGDDGAGVEVVRRLREPAGQGGIEVGEQPCEPTDLLHAWQGRDAVVLVDTMCSGAPPGTIRRFDASNEPLPARSRGSASTHAFGLDQAIELGRALHRLPRRVIVFAVEGRTFEAGAQLSDEVEAVAPALAHAVLREATELCTRRNSLTVTLSTLSSRGVTVDVDPSTLPEAGPRGVTVTFGLDNGLLAVTFTADEVSEFMAELSAVVAFAD
jgi:hydrogenase maturation protease